MTELELLQAIAQMEQGNVPEDLSPGRRKAERHWIPDAISFNRLLSGLKGFDLVADGQWVYIYANRNENRLVVYTEGDVDSIQYASREDFYQGLAYHAAFYAKYDRAIFKQLADYCRELSRDRSADGLEIG